MATSNPVAAANGRSSLAVGDPMTKEQIFAEVDADNGGSISFREFAEWWAGRQKATLGRVSQDILEAAWTEFEKHDTGQGLSSAAFFEVMEMLARGDWQKTADPSTGREYWVNPKTRESRWNQPPVHEFFKAQGIVDFDDGSDSEEEEGWVRTNRHGDEVSMQLNLWKIYKFMDRKDQRRFYTDAILYMVTLFVMFTLVIGGGIMPQSTALLKQSSAIIDLLLDEEFNQVENHKKNWFDIMTEQELWQWVEGPLFSAFYPDDDSEMPAKLLHSNELIGRIQFRTARVKPHPCPDLVWKQPSVENTCSAAWNHAGSREASPTYYETCRGPEPADADNWFQCTAEQYSWYERWGNFSLWYCEANDTPRAKCLPSVSIADMSCSFFGLWCTGSESPTPDPRGSTTAAREFADSDVPMSTVGYSEMRSTPAFVNNFMGLTRSGEYGQLGFAVTLPRNRSEWLAHVDYMQGKQTVCMYGNQCTVQGISGNETCGGSCCDGMSSGQCKTQTHSPFIDEYTRMLTISFSLHNGNNFDPDQQPATTAVCPLFLGDGICPHLNCALASIVQAGTLSGIRSNATSKSGLNDQYVYFQVTIAFGPGGHMEKYDRVDVIRPMRAPAYLEEWNTLILAVGLGLMVMFINVKELMNLRKLGWRSYFFESANSMWNKFELVYFGLVVYYIFAMWQFYDRTVKTEEDLTKLYEANILDDTYVDMYKLKSSFRTYQSALSLWVSSSVVKVFKYTALIDRMNFMWRIIGRASGDLAGFMAIFVLLMACFGFLATSMLGHEVREFHNLATSFFTLIRMSVGLAELDYTKMKLANAFWAPVITISFLVLIILISLNMFIAILSEYYEIIKQETRQWREDVAIFERQGMSVPTKNFVSMFKSSWNYFFLNMPLLLDLTSSNLPSKFIPVQELVAPRRFAGNAEEQAAREEARRLREVQASSERNPFETRIKQLRSEQLQFDTASNLLRLHYHSEFVPKELLAQKGFHARKNIPILGVLDPMGVFRTALGPLPKGEKLSPMNTLISRLGRMVDEETLEEKVTVVCVRLVDDDLFAESRPQVISKMKPRFPLRGDGEPAPVGRIEGKFGSDFGEENSDPDMLTMREHEFGAQYTLELLCHETVTNKDNEVFGQQRDAYALFRVAEISSWEHFSHEPSQLTLDKAGWTENEDRKLWDLMEQKGESKNMQSVQLAEMFQKSVREVELRKRFLKRRHRSVRDGYPLTPKALAMHMQPSKSASLRMWRAAWQDKALSAVSFAFMMHQWRASCRCSSYINVYKRDMKKFLRAKVQYVKDHSNIQDLVDLETNFLRENMELDEAIGKMKVYLVNSGRRNEEWLERHFSPTDQSMGGFKLANWSADFNEKELKEWLIKKYSSQIDCVIVKQREDEAESESEEEL